MSAHKFTYTVRLNQEEFLGTTLAGIRWHLDQIGVCDNCGSEREDAGPDDDMVGHTMIKHERPWRERPYWSTRQETQAAWEAQDKHSGYAVRCDNPECATVTPILRDRRDDD
jgi:hypothetical protein